MKIDACNDKMIAIFGDSEMGCGYELGCDWGVAQVSITFSGFVLKGNGHFVLTKYNGVWVNSLDMLYEKEFKGFPC